MVLYYLEIGYLKKMKNLYINVEFSGRQMALLMQYVLIYLRK